MDVLKKEVILAAQDIHFDIVSVPEWGGDVRICSMSAEQRDRYEQSLFATRAPDSAANFANIRARLAAYSIVDDAGAHIFGEEDIVALGQKSAAALDRVVKAAYKLSLLREGDIDELKKPSEPGPGAGSGSALPATLE
jgi:hypothetical protein